MKKAILSIVVLLISILSFGAASDFTVKVSSSTVEVGQRFQITFTINAQGGDFVPPNFKNFQRLSGPNQSQSMQYVNGRMSQSTSISYVLVASEKGTYTIGAASIQSNGKTKKTETIEIKVVAQNANAANAQRQKDQERKTEAQKLKEYVFVRATVDKTEAYVGEKVTVTYKLYSRLNLNGLDLESPTSFNGFWTQDLQTLYGRNLQKSRENFKGQVYDVVELQQTLLYPQRSGDLTIDALSILAKVQIQSRRARSVFEQMFGSYENKEVVAKSKPIKLKVKPLPTAGKPANFSGAVGKFSMKMTANKDSLAANESVNVKIQISGTGNLPLINAPKLNFPSDFEVYDPETKNNFKTTYNGSAGSKTFDYLVIPRHSGEFKLKPFEFSYFDVASKKYQTVLSDNIDFFVEKGEEDESAVFSSRRKEDIEVLGTDIRHIYIDDLELNKKGEYFYGSASFYLIIFSLLLIGLGVYFIAKKMKIVSSDKVGVRKSKANKLAKKRLATAKKHLDSKSNAAFYEEISTALFGYFADKFNLEVADLSQDKICELLDHNGHSNEVQLNVKNILEETEMARFAPKSSINPTILFEKSVELIQNVESKSL